MMYRYLLALLPFLLLDTTEAFTTPSIVSFNHRVSSHLNVAGEDSNALVEDIKTRFRILQESNASGAGFKQVVADVIAGEYDANQMKAEIEAAINSAPCVMFTWEKSPSCVKAVEAFDDMGVDYKVVRLDDPWSEGNPMRAELGKMVGRTSVPFIFIDGNYVGGYDGGVSDEAPGLVKMAFMGTLRTKLSDVGALREKAMAE